MWLGEVKLGGWRHSTDRWRLAGGAGFREVGAGCGVVYVDGARSIKLFCSWELHQTEGASDEHGSVIPCSHRYVRWCSACVVVKQPSDRLVLCLLLCV